MNQTSIAVTLSLKDHDLWKDVKTFADIGGNIGSTALRICQQQTHLKAIVCDLAKIKDSFEEYIPAEFKERISF